MRIALPVESVRTLESAAIDRDGEDTLMQRAAAGVAGAATRLLRRRGRGPYGARVLVLVGSGNNGGDALFAGARLARRGARVDAVRCLGRPHAAGLAALRTSGGRVAELTDLDPATTRYDLAIDGVLGIGGRPGLPDDVAALSTALEREQVPVVAVDLPSGVAADTGAVPSGAVRATITVTFGVLKPCHVIEPARSRCGEVEVVDIGLGDVEESSDPALAGAAGVIEWDELSVAARWPYPDARSDKYARGVVGVDTGSDAYPGAGVMSTTGAVYGGAGMVRFQGAKIPAELIRARLPNVVFGRGRVQAYVFGCGWGDRGDGRQVLAAAADSGLPAVVDADGLRYLPDPAPLTWLLTPHAGELARLLGRERSWVEEDPARAARAGAEQTGAVVLLKGASQLVAEPGESWIDLAITGPDWPATAGSGDVLAGVCGALLAAGRSAREAAVLAASLQALAARRHPGSVPPQMLAEHFAAVLGDLEVRWRETQSRPGQAQDRPGHAQDRPGQAQDRPGHAQDRP